MARWLAVSGWNGRTRLTLADDDDDDDDDYYDDLFMAYITTLSVAQSIYLQR
jgi:hypothetical protein